MIKNDLSKKFSKGTRIIHWLSTALILFLFPIGKYMSGLPASEKMNLIKVHIILGIIVFILTIFRTFLFFQAERPDHIKTGSKINDKIAVWIHNAFYVLLLLISVSGIAVLILGGYPDAFQSGNAELILTKADIAPLKGHGLFAIVMMLFLLFHVIGVIKHYIIKKENTLKRII